jgi:YVTN family beta-propeller protein
VAVGNGPTAIAVDPATHTLYTTNQNDNTVTVVNDAACNDERSSGCAEAVHTVALGKGTSPQAIALDAATGTLYVADSGTNAISVIDATTCNAENFSGCATAPRTVNKDLNAPNGVAVDPLTDTVYVADCGSECGGSVAADTVTVIDGATCNAEVTSGCASTPAIVKVGLSPDALAVDASTDTVYVADVANRASPTLGAVSVIDGATCNSTAHTGCGQHPPSITTPEGPNWIGLDPANGTAYSANNTNNGSAYSTVSVIDTATCNAVARSGCDQKPATVTVGSQPWALAVDPAVHAVYVANDDDDTLSVIDTSTCEAGDTSSCGKLQPTMQVGAGPQAVAVDPGTGTLYVANTIANTVSVLDPSSCDGANTRGCRDEEPVANAGPFPTGVALDLANSTVYVADQDADTVSVLNAATCDAARHLGCARPVASVHVGKGPQGVAIDPATGTAYVADSAGNTVSVIDIVTCNAEDTSGCDQAAPTVKVGKTPLALDVDQATDTVYVTDIGPNQGGHTVSVIDGATCNSYDHAGCSQVPATVDVGGGPDDLAVNQATNTVYVANTGDLDYTVTTWSQSAQGANGDTVSVIDGLTCNGVDHAGCGKPLATVKVGAFPFGVAVDEANNTVYVVNNNGGDGVASISVIKGATCDASDTSGCATSPEELPGPARAPRGLAFDPSTGTLFSANHADATVSVIDVAHPSAKRAARQLAVGPRPVDIVFDPANNTLYASDSFDGTVSVIPA